MHTCSKKFLAGCPSCSHRYESKADQRTPLQCPKCGDFCFCYACAHCNAVTFMPNNSGQCWNCKRLIPKASNTAGFFGHLFSVKCPGCSKKDKVVQFPEYRVKSKRDLALDPVAGAMSPWLVPRIKTLFLTEYFCCGCGCSWNSHRVEKKIDFS